MEYEPYIEKHLYENKIEQDNKNTNKKFHKIEFSCSIQGVPYKFIMSN